MPDAPPPAPLRIALTLHLAYCALLSTRLISALLLLAVAAGVGFQIPIEANLAGYHRALMNEGVHHGYGGVRVTPRDTQSIDHPSAIAKALADDPEVSATHAVLTFAGAVRAGHRDIRCAVRAVRGERYYRLRAGHALAPGDDGGVLLGTELAETLAVGVGDEVAVRVILETQLKAIDEDSVGRYHMAVRGIVEGSFGARDAVFLDPDFLAAEAGLEDEAHSLAIYLHDPAAAERVKARIASAFPAVEPRTWHEDSAYLRSNLGAIDAIARVSKAMVIAAVALPVLALLYINMLHRRRDVGLMAAAGLGRAAVFAVFLFQAATVGVAGVLLGCLLGSGLVGWFAAHPIFAWEGFVIVPVAAPSTYLLPALIVLATTLLAGALPAWWASRVDPARVLRGTG